MESFKEIEVQKINNNMEELLIVIQEQNKILQDTIFYFNEKKNYEIQSISRQIFNKIDGNKKLISLKMLSENANNRLKESSNSELFDKDEKYETSEEEDIFIDLQHIENRIKRFKDA